MSSMGEFWSSSHTAGGNGSYLEGYLNLIEDPASVPEDWKNYFDSLQAIPQEQIPHMQKSLKGLETIKVKRLHL